MLGVGIKISANGAILVNFVLEIKSSNSKLYGIPIIYANLMFINNIIANINPPIVIGPINIPAIRLDIINVKDIVLKLYTVIGITKMLAQRVININSFK